MTWKDALKVGFAQCFSLIPGTSRSGATIMGGMLFGLSRQAATEFSFFLAVPIMFAATGYEMVKYRDAPLGAATSRPFAVGFAVSFVAALVAVRGLIRYVAQPRFPGLRVVPHRAGHRGARLLPLAAALRRGSGGRRFARCSAR